jgi:glycosyltransferase involved in cell wall biosynthesis
MINVLYLPIGQQIGTEDAFKLLGVNLTTYDFYAYKDNIKLSNDMFLQFVQKTKPDLVHMQLQMTDIITVQSLIKAKEIVPNAIFTNWTGDIRSYVPKGFRSVSKVVDCSLISNTGQLDLYINAGCHNVKYWQIGYNPKDFYPKHKDFFKYNLSFAGSVYKEFPDSNLRYVISKDLKEYYKHKFGLFGSGYPNNLAQFIPMHELNDIYNDSVCTLSISNFNDVSHYFSDRLLMCLASGRPTIIYRFPGCIDYFSHMNDCFIVNNTQDIIDSVNYCIKNPEHANEIGYNGWLKAYSQHSFCSRIIELLDMVGLLNRC